MQCRRVAALWRCAGVVACVAARDARLCTCSTSDIAMLLFCKCVVRGIHSLFAAATALLLFCAEDLFAHAWRRCHRVVTCATVAVLLAL